VSTRHVDPLAATYAEVLGTVADARGGEALIQDVADALTALGEVWREDRNLRAFFLSGMVSEDEKRAALKKLLEPFPELLQDFVRLLIRRQRGRIIDQVAIAYQVWLDDRLGHVRVRLATAAPVPPERVAAWMDAIHRATQRRPVLDLVVRPELIAGATLEVGSFVVDGSAEHWLAEFKRRISERGKHALQA